MRSLDEVGNHRPEPGPHDLRLHRWMALAAVVVVAAGAVFVVNFAGGSGPSPAAVPVGESTPATVMPATPLPISFTQSPSLGRSASASRAATTSPASSTPGTPSARPSANQLIGSGVFFDDFAYRGPDDPAFQRAWSVRTDAGDPGQRGASWSAGSSASAVLAAPR